MKTILSIVPRLPPAIDGVGDYAYLLAEALADRHDISTKFVACDPLQSVESNQKNLGRVQLSARSQNSLSSTLDCFAEIDTLLLHYVGYGYAKRGCPLWLVAALTKWRQAKTSRRLVIMFHEVSASSNRPWSSQFWTSPIQQKIAKDLICLCDAMMTSNQLFANKIGELGANYNRKIDILPMISTIGECASLQPLVKRQPWLVIFGNTGFRKSIYTDSLSQLITICQQLEIEEIYDIGQHSDEIVKSVPQVKVNPMGILPAPEISQLFSMARAGFINYPIPYIAKSTIFAAYASHQLLPVFDRWNLGENLDGVNLNQHYYSIDDRSLIDLDSAQEIASNAYHWYCQHSLKIVTSRMADLLTKF